MKNLFRKLVNFKSLLNASPFSLINSKFIKVGEDVSDLFAFRLDGFETIFVAENNLALLIGRHIKCTHLFNFFSIDGTPCGAIVVEDDKFNYRLEINESVTNGKEVGSFTHHIKYPDTVLDKYSELLSAEEQINIEFNSFELPPLSSADKNVFIGTSKWLLPSR